MSNQFRAFFDILRQDRVRGVHFIEWRQFVFKVDQIRVAAYTEPLSPLGRGKGIVDTGNAVQIYTKGGTGWRFPVDAFEASASFPNGDEETYSSRGVRTKYNTFDPNRDWYFSMTPVYVFKIWAAGVRIEFMAVGEVIEVIEKPMTLETAKKRIVELEKEVVDLRRERDTALVERLKLKGELKRLLDL